MNGWDTHRRIVTINDAIDRRRPVPPRATCRPRSRRRSTPAGAVVASPPTAQAVLNYLRGDKSNEGINTTNFRTRSHILGDIVYSAAVPVGAPSAPYLDTGATDRQSRATTRSSRRKATRTPMVYVGGNDGMLHAFDDTVANGGKETWAYVPKALFSGGDPNDSAHTPSPAFQLGRAHLSGAAASRSTRTSSTSMRRRASGTSISPTPTRRRRRRPATTGARSWSAGSAPAGARSMRSTSPPRSRRRRRSCRRTRKRPPPSKVLWEFTDANLGYVYDAPTLVKTYAYGWVVLVASGYNNPGGKGFLYVLNPNAPLKAGQLLKKIALPGDTGTDTNPTGLEHHPRLHGQPPESVRAAGLRRRPQGQRLALRPFQSRREPMEGGEDRDAEGRRRQARSRSRPASGSKSTRTTTSIAICSSAPASCSISRISSTRRSSTRCT